VVGLLIVSGFFCVSIVEQLPAADESKMAEGTVVSAGSGKLVVKNDKNQEQTYSVDSSAKVMIDGKMAKLEDLKKESKVSVALDGEKVISVTSNSPTKQERDKAG
jgi:hypothetical protein